MNRQRFASASVIALLLLTLLSMSTATQATILTFDVQFGGSYGGSASFRTFADYQPYGDNVSTTSVPSGGYTLNYLQGNDWTPDVAVSYDVGTATSIDIRSDSIPGSNWDRVARLTPGGQGGAETDRRYYFTFNPAAGYAAVVNSFDLIRYNLNGATGGGTAFDTFQVTADWFLYESAGLTTSGGLVTAVGGNLVASGSVSLGDATSDAATIVTGAGKLLGPAVLVIRDTTVLSGTNRLMALDNLNFDQALPEPASALLLCGPSLLLLRRRRILRD